LKMALDALETELSIDWGNQDEFNASAEKMYKAIAVIKEALAQPEQNIAAFVEGMEVSIDVSTGEHDSTHRLFGVVTLIQENQGSKHGLILLVQEPKANFKEALAQPEPCDMGDICIGCSPRNADGSCPSSQPEQEPVAWRVWNPDGDKQYLYSEDGDGEPLYTHSQRKPLTDDEMEATFIECGGKWNGDFWKIEDADFHPFLRTIEAKLKELNDHGI